MPDCCPFCGAELGLSAERCRDCNLAQDPGARPALVGDDSLDEAAYEVTDWPTGSRLRLTAALAERGVPWRWEPVLNLIVREQDAADTEAVLDEIEADELGTAAGGAPEDGDEDWDDDGEDDDGEDDDVDDVEDDDEDQDDDGDYDDEDEYDIEDDDGAPAQAAMADLFVAADRLMHEPENLEVAVDLDNAAEVVASSPPPFGVDDETWTTIRRQAGAVRAALDEPEADDLAAGEDTEGADHDVIVGAVVSERAQELRDTLRPWV